LSTSITYDSSHCRQKISHYGEQHVVLALNNGIYAFFMKGSRRRIAVFPTVLSAFMYPRK
jgi:hypothetical protein